MKDNMLVFNDNETHTEIRPYDTEYREYDKDYKFEYCSDCGQKLYWSDEEWVI